MHPPGNNSLPFDKNHETFDTSSESSTPSPASDYYHTPPEIPFTSTPTTPSSPISTPDTMAQEKQNDINIPLTREQLHQLNNDQLVMTIMASSVLLQSRLNMHPIDEVDKVLAVYEALVKREGKEHASMVGLIPQLDGLIENIELVTEKEKPEGEFDRVLDISSGAVYEKVVADGTGGDKSGRTSSKESLRSESSNGSEAGTYLSRFYTSQSAGGGDGVNGRSAAENLIQNLGMGGMGEVASEERKNVVWADENVRSR